MYNYFLKIFKSHNYASIDPKQFDELKKALIIDHYAYVNSGEKIPQSYFELRDWVYTRIEKDIKYQDTGYLNDHFCIGVVYGMLRMFDSLSYLED